MTANGSIHALGNGLLCAYGQGPDLIQVFGPPYSSPAIYRFLLEREPLASIRSAREPGAAIWHHTLFISGKPAAEMLDFVDADLPCLVRRVKTTLPLHFTLQAQPPARVTPNEARLGATGAAGGILLEAPPGTYIYHVYPAPKPIFHQIAWKGPVSTGQMGEEGQAPITVSPGEAVFYFASGVDYPQVVECSEAALSQPWEAILDRTRRGWQAFTRRRMNFSARLPGELPYREALLEAIDDVAVLIKTQQSAEGAVLAGHNYHLGYVRDQYGVARGLLALGHTLEARRILDFYWETWQRHGRIHNAQAAGVDGVFHIHEHDRAEITGYLIRQAFDLLERTGDGAFVRRIFPMLAWAFQAQVSELAGGMLPFNGDETYIAGGVLPRSVIEDGSAEATLLFIDGGEKLTSWAGENGLWDHEQVASARRAVETARNLYRKNFWKDGRLQTNNPERRKYAVEPRFRHGVCERCCAEGRLRGIEWTERTASGRYLCPGCLARGPYPPAPPTIYELLSVSLTPVYFHSGLFQAADLRPTIESILRLYETTGRLPSRPEDPRGTTVGYDYGLLLYALTEIRHPRAQQFAEQTLALRDSAGAWVEYYLDHRPAGTRCRPWESAINIEALLHFAGEG